MILNSVTSYVIFLNLTQNHFFAIYSENISGRLGYALVTQKAAISKGKSKGASARD